MDSIKPLQWRYATKKFDETKLISEAAIDVIKEAFNLTPTSYGLQPVKLVVVHNKALQQTLFAHTFKQKQISTASHVLVFCTETKIDADFIEENFKLVKKIRNTPDKILKPYRKFLLEFFGEKSEKQKQEWAVNQVYLTLGNVLNVCATEGIDACPMEGFDAENYDKTLQLAEKGLQSRLILPIGYRAEDDMFAELEKVRRPLNETIIDIG